MNPFNRSFMLQQPALNIAIQSARKTPSITPNKSQNRIRVGSKERAGSPSLTQRNNEASSVLFLQKNDSFEKKRKQSPLEKTLQNPQRLSSLHRNRQVSVSQIALNQVLSQIDKKSNHLEMNSSQINSHILTTSSSNKPHRLSSVSLDEYNKLIREFNQQQKLVIFLKQKIGIVEQFNISLLEVTKQCQDCQYKLQRDLKDYINNIQQIEQSFQTILDQPLSNLLNSVDSFEQNPIRRERIESFNQQPEPLKYLKELHNTVDIWQEEVTRCMQENQFYQTIIRQNHTKFMPSVLSALSINETK